MHPHIHLTKTKLMKTPKLIPILLSLLFLATCKKDPPIDPEPTEPIMPPLTHQGLNTFGCYIDGELFVAGGGDSYWDLPPVSGSFNEENNRLGVQGTRYREGKSDYLTLISYLVPETGDFDFGPFEWEEVLAYRNWYGDRCDYYYTDISDLGKLSITFFDKEKHIVSGKFYMNIVNNSCEGGDTLMKITDGRFDFHY